MCLVHSPYILLLISLLILSIYQPSHIQIIHQQFLSLDLIPARIRIIQYESANIYKIQSMLRAALKLNNRLSLWDRLAVFAFTQNKSEAHPETQVQQHKPTPIQTKVQREGIMAKKQLDNNYRLINSSPTDNITEIEDKFIMMKKKLNDRHIYIPNKKEYLERLDQAYEQVMKVHSDYVIVESDKPKGKIFKRDLIAYELNQIRKAKKYELLQTYEFAGLMLIVIITLEIIIEEYGNRKDQRLPITSEFEIGRRVTAKLKEAKTIIGRQIEEKMLADHKFMSMIRTQFDKHKQPAMKEGEPKKV